MGADVVKLAHIIEADQVTDKYANEGNKLGSEYFPRFEHGNDLDRLAKSCVDDLSRSILPCGLRAWKVFYLRQFQAARVNKPLTSAKLM